MENTVYIISYKTKGEYNQILNDSKKRFEEQKERFANKEVHILGPNVMTHRDVEDRRNVGYDALENS
mgnify:CR=1 FL=1